MEHFSISPILRFSTKKKRTFVPVYLIEIIDRLL